MPGLRFPLVDLLRETRALKIMAKRFLGSGATWVLDRFLNDLVSIGDAGEGNYNLSLQSLHTTSSKDYEPGGRQGGQNIHAVISGTWDLRPLGRPKLPKRQIEFCGKASTIIELYKSDNPETERLGMWRLELGTEDSPGCYIHAQILGDSDDSPFPKSVPIPRLPSFFITPMSAVEFVLGELFQDEWTKETAVNTGDTPWWRTLQQQRFYHLFSWYQARLKNKNISPWMVLKETKPEDGCPDFSKSSN